MRFSFKTRIIIFILLTTIVLSCKKNDTTVTQPSIIGKWNWFATYKIYASGILNPLTPNNTGIIEQVAFNADGTWTKTQNFIIVDSGTYSVGHGTYTSSSVFVYDSIQYYQHGVPLPNAFDCYYFTSSDTLVFDPYKGGRYNSYSLPNGGNKWMKRL